MRYHRNLKIASLIQKSFNDFVLREFNLEKVFLTVVGVEVANDLSLAKIKISVFPSEKNLEAYQILDNKKSFIQFKLLRKMNIRPMPKITFEFETEDKK